MWSLSDPGTSRTAPNLQLEMGKIGQQDLKSAYPQHLEQGITLYLEQKQGAGKNTWEMDVREGTK